MTDTFAVAVLECWNYLTIYAPRIIFIHSAIWLWLQKSMCRPPAYILHHKYYLALSFDSLIQFSNMRMIKPLHQLDLPSDTLPSLYLLHLFFFINFHCNLFVGFLVKSDMNSCIGALTYLFTDYIVIQWSLRTEYYYFFLYLFISYNFLLFLFRFNFNN